MGRKIYDRQTKTVKIQRSDDDKLVNFMYCTALGRIFLKLVFSTRAFSFLCGIYYSSGLSKRKVVKFAAQNNIDFTQCEKKEFKSFNEFFTRKEKREFSVNQGEIISPCDGFVSAYKIDDNLSLPIKGRQYSVGQLLKNGEISPLFAGGTCVVCRLTLQDYHRYIFTHSGEILQNYFIKGRLHTVRPIENSNHCYFENTRNIAVLNTNDCGQVAQIEVGAMLVGKIINHKDGGKFERLEEKGFFAYGGSTIVVLYRKGTVKIDDDILNFTKKDIETKVQMGEKIGYIKATKHIL